MPDDTRRAFYLRKFERKAARKFAAGEIASELAEESVIVIEVGTSGASAREGGRLFFQPTAQI